MVFIECISLNTLGGRVRLLLIIKHVKGKDSR